MLAAMTVPVLMSLLGSLAVKIDPSSRQMTVGIENVNAICSGRR